MLTAALVTALLAAPQADDFTSTDFESSETAHMLPRGTVRVDAGASAFYAVTPWVALRYGFGADELIVTSDYTLNQVAQPNYTAYAPSVGWKHAFGAVGPGQAAILGHLGFRNTTETGETPFAPNAFVELPWDLGNGQTFLTVAPFFTFAPSGTFEVGGSAVGPGLAVGGVWTPLSFLSVHGQAWGMVAGGSPVPGLELGLGLRPIPRAELDLDVGFGYPDPGHFNQGPLSLTLRTAFGGGS